MCQIELFFINYFLFIGISKIFNMFQGNFDIICEVCNIVFVVACAKFFGLPVLNLFGYLWVKDRFLTDLIFQSGVRVMFTLSLFVIAVFTLHR